MTAEVIVDVAHSSVDKIFDYTCPDNAVVGSRVKVPFGGRVISGFIVRIKEKSTLSQDKLKSVISVYDEPPALTAESLFLTKRLCDRYRTNTAAVLRLFLPSEMRKDTVNEIYEKYLSVSETFEQAYKAIGKTAHNQRAAAEFVKASGETAFSLLVSKFGRSAVNTIIEKGILSLTEKRALRTPYTQENSKYSEKTLTEHQKNALNSITSSSKTVQLLHGVTGSGKTEVYLRLIQETVKSGKTAIFLVPEISLTPKTLKELRAHFKESAAILHSGLSAGERFDEWQRLRSKSAKIAVGARSAIFAPLEDVGIIILDEEHDSSYISESSPRYSTFEVALMRADYNKCKIVLGSATPSVESYNKAVSGAFNLVQMPERINKRALPEFIISDMKIEARRGNNTAFSSALTDALKKTLESKNQAIIFLNRRGFAQHIICRDCGYIAKCTDCDITLTYHSDENELKCHYCGKRYKMLDACPDCGGTKIRYAGTGTQRVAAELKKMFHDAKILRMDNDTTSGKDGHYKVLKSFAEKKADILVGTQMIAKGHDFPSVTLVGILDADMSLNFPDYRSRERTFQLLTQVAGRSGRGEEKGIVVLQTYNPEHEILKYAVNYDYKLFFEREIALRKTLSYPPFSTILRVMSVSEDKEKAAHALKAVYTSLESLYNENKDGFSFFAKMHSPVKRIQKKHRMQILAVVKDPRLVKEIYDRSSGFSDRDVNVYVEENPGSLS